MIKVRVPASTANLGPGFDCFGMALNLYNEFEFDETEKDVVFLNNGKQSLIPLKDNLIYNSMIKAFQKYKYKPKGLYINVLKSDVPISRGLGSSATCIAAGLAAANFLMNGIMSKQDMLNLGAEIEGHPDNVVPAIMGGFDVSMCVNGNIVYSKIELSEDLIFAALIPDFEISTLDSRKILPESYSRADCIFNISHASFLIWSLCNKDFSKLRYCFQDKIHEPYRGRLIENINDIFEKAIEFGSLGEFISGSGSTLMAVIDKNNDTFYTKMSKFLSTLKSNWKIKLLKADTKGVRLSVEGGIYGEKG